MDSQAKEAIDNLIQTTAKLEGLNCVTYAVTDDGDYEFFFNFQYNERGFILATAFSVFAWRVNEDRNDPTSDIAISYCYAEHVSSEDLETIEKLPRHDGYWIKLEVTSNSEGADDPTLPHNIISTFAAEFLRWRQVAVRARVKFGTQWQEVRRPCWRVRANGSSTVSL